MTERRQRIPASEVEEPKRWNLPYWTEPKHLVHAEHEEAEVDEEVLVEEEEIEVEPLTAEQLEIIRQEAFNEGLEQGLVEGRQKGEKLGYEDGHKEGLEAGQQEGKKLGFDAGFEQGEKQAFTNGSAEQEKIAKRYMAVLENIQQDLKKQKQELEANIPDIVLAIAKSVITEELSQGSEHIITLVQQALEALPIDSGDLRIDVNPQDLPFIEAAIEQGEFDGVAHSAENIEAGGCRIHTRYSSVDFTLSERWQNIERQYRHQLQLALNQEEDEEDVQPNFDELDHTQSSFNEALDTQVNQENESDAELETQNTEQLDSESNNASDSQVFELDPTESLIPEPEGPEIVTDDTEIKADDLNQDSESDRSLDQLNEENNGENHEP